MAENILNLSKLVEGYYSGDHSETTVNKTFGIRVSLKAVLAFVFTPLIYDVGYFLMDVLSK